MHTEDEARKLWCPMVRIEAENRSMQVNETDVVDLRYPWCRCIASDCAMWRWGMGVTAGGIEVPSEIGYCGLAGKP